MKQKQLKKELTINLSKYRFGVNTVFHDEANSA